jgi:hypothetical protein
VLNFNLKLSTPLRPSPWPLPPPFLAPLAAIQSRVRLLLR